MFNAAKQQLVQLNKGTKNICLENDTYPKWIKNTTLLVGDSILSGIEENRTSCQWIKVKVKSFPGATVEDMCDYIKPLLKKCPKNIIAPWHKEHRKINFYLWKRFSRKRYLIVMFVLLI